MAHNSDQNQLTQLRKSNAKWPHKLDLMKLGELFQFHYINPLKIS